jgi:membrane-anchored glycerophosphoryl diester phosphodiesterase (GDPDase)
MKFDSNLAWKHASSSIGANREVLLALSGVFFLLPNLALALFVRSPEPVAGQTEAQMVTAIQTYYLAALPYMIPIMLLQAMGTLAVLTLFTDTSRPTVGAAIKQGLVGTLSYIAAQILLGIAVGIMGGMVLTLGAATGVPAVAGLAIALVLLAVVYVYIKTSLVAPVIAVERQRNPVTALQRSWRLTKGNSLRIALFYLLLLLAFLVVFGVIMMVVGLILAAVAGLETTRIAAAVVSSALTAVMTLYFVGAMAAVHRQLAGPSPEAASAPFD